MAEVTRSPRSPQRPRSAHQRPRLRVRSLLLLVVAIPTMGMGALGLRLTSEAMDTRETSQQVESQSEELAAVIDARIAINGEMTQSSIVSVASDLGVDIADLSELYGIDYQAELDAARATVDADPTLMALPELSDGLAGLRALRGSIDAGTTTFVAVRTTMDPIIAGLDDIWQDRFDHLQATLRLADLAGALSDQAGVVESTFDALQAGANRAGLATALVQDGPDPQSIAGLLDTTARQEAALEHVAGLFGPATRRTWIEYQADPAVQRFEQTLDSVAEAYLVGDASPLAGDPVAFGEAFVDATPWITGLSNMVGAAATDLRDVARRQEDRATGDLQRQASYAFLLTALTLGGTLLLARSLTRPVRLLEAAAHEIEHGRFDLPLLETKGPRELADTAAAFNEMATTLAAVEQRAVALADTSEDPILNEPLPGRIGQALQDALDRLRTSMRDAEARRRELEEVATHDGLTGLLNRNAAIETIERDLAIASRTGAHVVAMFVDLDGLKTLNDEQGHATGDEALRLVAEALRATTRGADTVARLGGDEFLVASMPGERDSGEVLAERIRHAVSRQVLVGPDGPTPLRCSIGLALSDPTSTSADDLIHRADSALYLAKRRGRNRVAWDDPVLGSEDGHETLEDRADRLRAAAALH
jgi:diguanylate cyclase (GGDEF)-like protein